MSNKENVNNQFFDGHYKDFWRAFIPEQLTQRELDFMLSYFELKAGSKVLDLMCGYGRHAVGLARKGIEVTAVDNLPDYIEEIAKTVSAEHLPLKHVQSDILDFQTDEKFDLAICMGNSLNFFDEEDCTTIMTNVAKSLKPSGKFFINTWSLAEIVIKNFIEKSWSHERNFKILTDAVFCFNPTRIETEYSIIDDNGNSEIKNAVDFIFSLQEVHKLLAASGLSLIETYSVPGQKKFGIGDPRAYLIAIPLT